MRQPDTDLIDLTLCWSCWLYPWCRIVRVHSSVHSAPCESTLTLYSSDTDHSLTAFCFLPLWHTHTYGPNILHFCILCVFLRVLQREGLRKECFSTTIKRQKRNNLFSINLRARFRQWTNSTHRNTAGIYLDVSCDKLTVLNSFQLKEFKIIFNSNKMFTILHKDKYRKRKMVTIVMKQYTSILSVSMGSE